MVKAYLDKHPNLTPTDWLEISANEIFEQGHYLPNYE